MEFYGLLGEKLSHSLSPQIHKRIFDLIGIEGAYKLFPVPKDKVKKLGEGIKIFGIRGMNVTIPYKKEVMDQLDFISDEARKIGAVNTISLENGKLYGYNTDYYGFGCMLDINKIEVKDKRAVVLGTGGAAKAVVTYLQDKGVKELFVVSRNKVNNNWNGEVNLIDYSDLQSLEGDLLINTTPVGMYPNV
ncbi:shikimate dehydrogenase, partial [Clostridium sp.]